MARTRHVAELVGGARRVAALGLRPAGSQSLEDAPPLGLLPVGDAASCFDSVSAQGIAKALRSGIYASYAIADWLCRGDARGLERYRGLLAREFDAYRSTLRKYYALEARWPHSPFWRRRQAGPAATEMMADSDAADLRDGSDWRPSSAAPVSRSAR